MGLHKKSIHPHEVKLEAIMLREEEYHVKEIQKLLDMKSESQVYKWWYWYRDG
ncbi:transposase [Erysipelothrix rhusiopathiae]|nr:transposase [Erysipelothrix rhusiopathiae]